MIVAHKNHWLYWRMLLVGSGAVLVTIMAVAAPRQAHAGTTSWPQETNLFLSGSNITLKILAGSVSDSLSVNTTTFTVTVGTGDSFTVRYPGPNPGQLTNNSTISPCGLINGNIEATVVGPRTVTFTPSSTACPPSGGGGGGGTATGGASPPPSVTLSHPNGGEVFNTGAIVSVQWFSSVVSSNPVKIRLSTDGGLTYPTLIADLPANYGNYSWTVPTITTASAARLKVEVISGSVTVTDVSDNNFTIKAPPAPPLEEKAKEEVKPTVEVKVEAPPPVVDPTSTGTKYDPTTAVTATPTIDVNLGTEEKPVVETPRCAAGSLIKGKISKAVYYCAKDGRRYGFPNQLVFFTWFPDFSSVITFTDEELAAIPFAGNITYRPGMRLVKIQTDPKVYAVSRGGLLRWMTSEAIAIRLYGADWATMVDDVPDAFFFNYKIGDPITEVSGTEKPPPPVAQVAPKPPAPAQPTSTPSAPTPPGPAPEAAPVAACVTTVTFTEFLQLGSSSPQVKALQSLLQCLGHFPANLNTTTYFGSATAGSVRRFQSANGFVATGSVGRATRAALNKYKK